MRASVAAQYGLDVVLTQTLASGFGANASVLLGIRGNVAVQAPSVLIVCAGAADSAALLVRSRCPRASLAPLAQPLPTPPCLKNGLYNWPAHLEAIH
jgi:hypothetical protein